MFNIRVKIFIVGVSPPAELPPAVDYNTTNTHEGQPYPGIIVGGCAGTRYGCCLDGKRAAEGPDSQGCPEGKITYLLFLHFINHYCSLLTF